ncbi:MAG: 3-oxoacyl-[acyl-carrier-protein] reductase [Bdellovibrionaceae bacterium]|nr:3-oxoacyl-[acyl-carrier-protein] reductase [Pseudobdellovibrionaceae bacterium]|tara:strand:- start:1179 stop:1922 length:744 start_codon:yes stop_codon:yes gene_type:complete
MAEQIRKALVTGGSRGIGAEISKRLAKDGFFVFVNYTSNKEKAIEVVDDISKSGGQAQAIQLDVSDFQAVEEVLGKLQKEMGPLDVLVNNAGITRDSLLIRMKPEDLDATLDIDLKGAIYCTKAVAKSMMKTRKGSIIQISSVVGEMGNPGQSAYAAAKAGLIGFTKSVAKEFASRGLRVNTVTPGYIQTDMTGALTEDQKEAILRSIPLGTLGEPQDIASLVSFLASDESRYITGQTIGVNGGMYM